MVIWSDECAVRKESNPSTVWSFRRQDKGEKYDPKNVVKKVKQERVFQMIWACFAGSKLGPIGFMEGILFRSLKD